MDFVYGLASALSVFLSYFVYLEKNTGIIQNLIH